MERSLPSPAGLTWWLRWSGAWVGTVVLATLVGLGCRGGAGPSDACAGTCGERAFCDAVIDQCFCEVGTLGDPLAGCEPHGDVCGEAEARLGHPACEHEIPDTDTWSLLSIGHANHAAFRRGAKYLVPAVPDARLPTLFANTNWYRIHYCVMARAFEPDFPGLSHDDYVELVLERRTREYYGGTISELSIDGPDGPRFVFTVEISGDEEELLSQEQIYGVYRQLQDRFAIGSLSYFPDSPLHLEQAEGWDDAPFPVLLVPEAPGPQYEAYTPGLAYGRVRLFTDAELAGGGPLPFGWQDIIVVDHPPLSLEGVMAGSVSAVRQDVLTHLNVLSSVRGTPNVHVANALEVLAPYEGQLVRFEALPTAYSIREATPTEAEEFWAQQRPHADVEAQPDFEFGELLGLDEIATASAGQRSMAVSRFGSKAAGLAVLRAVADRNHIATGLGIPMSAYFSFMSGNTWDAPVGEGTQSLTYAETIDTWLSDDAFRSDAQLRGTRLEQLRVEMLEHGVVDPALLDEIRRRVGEVLGDESIMLRFRSSSNAEDSLSFNGAGLYESVKACVLDEAAGPSSACEPGKRARPADIALKQVWASLWGFGAFEEREYYQIDHREVGMGILVNPRFADERANGVAFTGNPSDLDDPRFTINVQLGDVPVVSSTFGVVAELDRVRFEGGAVVSIDREITSSLLPDGGTVLDDARVTELATLMADIVRVYPIDATPPEGTEVMLDMEFKITADDVLMLKQIRPFAAHPYAPGDELCR